MRNASFPPTLCFAEFHATQATQPSAPPTIMVYCRFDITRPVQMFPNEPTLRFATAIAELCGKSNVRLSTMMPLSRHTFSLALGIASLVVAPVIASAETPQEKGLRIALESRERSDGFGNFTAGMTMALHDRHGRESIRQMRFKVLEAPNEGEGDKSLFVFDQPLDVQGTALLTHVHTNADDDQWLYLPALKRVKRISASKRSGSFMGSEFTFEDMTSPEVEEYHHRYLRDEPCGELTCTVTEQVPLDPKSGYSRKVVWQDGGEYRAWKVELYDRKGMHVKTLTFEDYQQYLDRFWRAGKQIMVNHQTGARTVLRWTDYRFGTDLDDREFTHVALRRAR